MQRSELIVKSLPPGVLAVILMTVYVTLDGFIWLISGQLYQHLLFNITLISIWERVRVVTALLLAQFGLEWGWVV